MLSFFRNSASRTVRSSPKSSDLRDITVGRIQDYFSQRDTRNELDYTDHGIGSVTVRPTQDNQGSRILVWIEGLFEDSEMIEVGADFTRWPFADTEDENTQPWNALVSQSHFTQAVDQIVRETFGMPRLSALDRRAETTGLSPELNA